jgi:hypothetical protein
MLKLRMLSNYLHLRIPFLPFLQEILEVITTTERTAAGFGVANNHSHELPLAGVGVHGGRVFLVVSTMKYDGK